MNLATTLLVLTATAAGLLAVAFWWIRRNHPNAYPPGRAPSPLRPLPAGSGTLCPSQSSGGCGRSAVLMAAAAPDGGTGPSTAASSSARPPRRKKVSGPSRRQFLRTTWLLGLAGSLVGFGGASLGFLWPNLRGGFGSDISVDTEDAILTYIRDNREPYPYPSGRMYLVAYDPSLDPQGLYAELTNGANVMALYQRCVHLGCKVPWCLSAQWFQCPCHGSNYNRWGEYQLGPAPRGLDRFALRVEDGTVIVNTATIVEGPARTAGVLRQPQEGPSCV